MPLPTVNAIWIGPSIGPIHAACLRSFLRHGHDVVLHCYTPPSDLPPGVKTADARQLLPETMIFKETAKGSYAAFANLLRYEILSQGLGLYADCDVFCLKPIEDSEYIFGREDNRTINNAILKLPRDCPVLDGLRKFKRKLRKDLSDMRWGTTGVRAVTKLLTEHGMDRLALPIDLFYPVHWSQVALLADPHLRISDLVTRRSRALHLVNQSLLSFGILAKPIAPTSPLGEIMAS